MVKRSGRGNSAIVIINFSGMRKLPHWIIIYGTDRNSGKTSLIEKIISRFHSNIPICAVKISPHFHSLAENTIVVHQTDQSLIVREHFSGTGKDSSRMLDAGAELVFYVQVWDENLDAILPELMRLIPEDHAVICESGWARNLVEPGLFLILHRKGNKKIKESAEKFKDLADAWIEFDGQDFDFQPERISFDSGWILGPVQ
jgi:hypothetical protein